MTDTRPDIIFPGEPLIQLRGLTRTYQEGQQERAVLSDVNAEVMRGEFAILMGPSGSGKSTLLNLISGIDLPTSGEVVIDSINLTSLSEKKRTLFRRKNIGFVFQFFNLIPTLTVEENLLLPPELKGNAGSNGHAEVTEILSAVGLDDRAKSFPDRLAGGEQQRVAVARALVHDPAVILADEPTGNLDTSTSLEIMRIIENLNREQGITVVLVTHEPEIAAYADRVLTFRDGEIVDDVTQSLDPGALAPRSSPASPALAEETV